MGVLYFDSLALQAMSRSLLSWQQQSASPNQLKQRNRANLFSRDPTSLQWHLSSAAARSSKEITAATRPKFLLV